LRPPVNHLQRPSTQTGLLRNGERGNKIDRITPVWCAGEHTGPLAKEEVSITIARGDC
jgi:hypothetical protein